MAKTGKMQLLGPKFYKMTAPNLGPNSLCGPNTVFQGNWLNQGGGPQDRPKKLQFVAQAAFGGRNGHVEAQNGPLETTNGHLEAQKVFWKLKTEHFEAQNDQKCQNAGFGGQILQNDRPKFLVKFFIWA